MRSRTLKIHIGRRALLSGMVLAAAVLFAALAAWPARAAGGAGGDCGGGNPGGAGGTGFTGTPGATVTGCGGGGGGGAGGGPGGDGDSAGPPAASGGAGGTAVGPNGQSGGNAFGDLNDGGGGGGGGYNGNGAGAATISNGSALAGGNGGAGGNGPGLSSGGGGGGGAGGYGAIVTGSGASSNTSTITGGNGGAGGASGAGGSSFGGNGGDGGVGVQFTTTGATFTNSGTATGGNGGAAGAAVGSGSAGAGGAGGAGIVGAGLTVINSGTISGGVGGVGGAGAQANAITFTSGSNILELQAGSTITGTVAAFSTADTFRLGGASNASFDVSQIGTQYLGFGIFQKAGSSTWTLTGTNAAALPWAINAGTLAVNGTLSSSTMTVNSGGTLAGTGTVGSVTVTSGGTFAPGSGAGGSTMSLAGSLAFQSGALYLVQVNPSTASSANVTGTATLTGGGVQAVFASGSYVVRSYDILHSGGLVGTFSGVSGNVPAGFSESLSYTATDVLLNLTAGLGAGGGLNQNQQNVANGLNNFFNGGGALPPGFVSVFGLTGGNLANTLTLISGEAATGAQQGAFQLMDQFLGVMLDPFVGGMGGSAAGPSGAARAFAPERAALPDDIALAYAQAMKAPVYKAPPGFEQRWTAWAAGYGGYNTTRGDAVAGSHDLTARAGGVAAGLDYHLTRDTVAGFALAGAGTDWTLAQGLGGGRSDAFQAGLYGATRSGPAYLAASLAFADHWMSTDRFAAFGDHLAASFNAQSLGGRLEGGYRFGAPAGGIAPYAAVQAQSFRTPSYSESDLTGGGFALAYNARSATDTRSELGARFEHVAPVEGGAVVTLRGRLAWAHDWITDPALAAVFQALPGAGFIVNGATPASDSALVSAGAELHLVNGVALIAKFDGELASRSQTYAGTGTIRYSW